MLSVSEHLHLAENEDWPGLDDEEVASGLDAGVAAVERVALRGSARVVEADGSAACRGRHGDLRGVIGQAHREVCQSRS